MSLRTRRAQSGITALGFLFLAVLFGVVGLAAIKLTPMYIKKMQLSRVLDDVQGEVRTAAAGGEITPAKIRAEIDKRLNIEQIELPKDSVKIAPSKEGYNVHIQYENRVPYAGDVYLLLAFDKQVEIRK